MTHPVYFKVKKTSFFLVWIHIKLTFSMEYLVVFGEVQSGFPDTRGPWCARRCRPVFCNFWPFYGFWFRWLFCVVWFHMHTHSDNILAIAVAVQPVQLVRRPRYACGGWSSSFFSYRRYFYFTENTLFGIKKKSFRSPVQKWYMKNITKKVQAYFKHLCALKLNFEAKMIWVCITKICLILFSYDENLLPL